MMKNLFLILLLVVSTFNYLVRCKAVDFYVSPRGPDQSTDCNSHYPCYTLSEYAANSSALLSNKPGNISLFFLNGVHILSNQNLEIKNVTNLTISGIDTGSVVSSFHSVIQIYSGQIKFHGFQELRMENVEIRTVSHSNSCIDLSDFRHLSCQNIHTERCTVTINMNNHQDQSNTNLSGTFMSSDYLGTFMTTAITVSINGSTFNLSSLEVITEESSHTRIFISQSDFLDSSENGIFIKMGNRSSSDIVIRYCTIARSNKQGLYAWNGLRSDINIQILECRITENFHTGILVMSIEFACLNLNIERSTIKSSMFAVSVYKCQTGKIQLHHCDLSNNSRHAILLNTSNSCNFKNHNEPHTWIILITNSIIHRNAGGVQLIVFHVFERTRFNIKVNLTLVNCLIAHNQIRNVRYFESQLLNTRDTAILSIWAEQQFFEGQFLLKNVSFINNRNYITNTIVQFANTDNVTIEDCLFRGNTGTPIKAYSSNFFISGHTVFENNVANQGGALSLFSSTVYLSENSNVTFIYNTAYFVGGAIYVETYHEIVSKLPRCFYRFIRQNALTNASVQASLYFSNNTAGYGGEDIYGASVHDTCNMSPISEKREYGISSMFHFNNKSMSLSSISSDPKRVCPCDKDGHPQCGRSFARDMRYPGERFNISVVVVGMEYGTVTGSVYAQILNRGLYPLGTNQHSQAADYRHCNELTYSVHSHQEKETLVLTANEAIIGGYYPSKTDKRNDNPVFIIITMRECPLGFTLQGEPPSCHCHNSLTEVGIVCDIINRTGVMYRSGRVWVNAAISENGVAIHKYCPYDYCNEMNTSVDLRYPDTQCALNHSGILCGGCLPNLSLALGSNQCLPCSNNNHLTLLLFFIAAGFMLVIFLKLLDLTIAKGTINGLIFYANIVWAYQSVLFPAQDNTNLALQCLKVFLAWLNLDFGIQTCFTHGLNAYWKTWLQFVFPIYVWAIVGFIIVTSHYFTLAGKLFGNNSVPVLATLFLLSYAKLVRTIITVLGFVFLHYPDHTSVVWTLDGNLSYFGLEHTFLFVAALVALLFFWLPFVSTLLLVPWLKRKAHLKPLHWINRWKPFYDAYYGPLKDKHHYWVGLLLIVRGGLLVLFSLTSATAPDISILAMILTPSVLLLYTSHIGNVYKNRLLSLFENLFFINMIFLGSGILYVKTVKGSKATIVHISIWFTFGQFVCILIFHLLCLVKKHCSKRLNGSCPKFIAETNRVKLKDVCTIRRNRVQLRESLLEESYEAKL